MANNVRVAVSAPGAKQASSEMDSLRDKFSKLQSQGAKGFAIGAGAAITAKGINIMADAASGAVGILGDMVKAAMEDEESVSRLGASLRTNVPNWQGNTDAIESSIKSAQRLGFADETLRDSLSVLVGATHDVGKAQSIMAIAMDLARFKGIDLQTASEALIKVEGGHYKMLAQLGISLKAGATQTEALAAVQRVAQGQAEAYANTTSGKLLAAQIAINEAMEAAGKTILPLVAEGLNDVSYALDRSLVPLDKLRTAAAKGVAPARAELEALTKAAQENGLSVDALYKAWSGSGESVAVVAERMAGRSNRAMSGMGDHAGKLADDVAVMSKSIGKSARAASGALADASTSMAGSIDRLHKRMIADAEDSINKYFDVLITEDDLAANSAEISAQRRILASKTATAAEKRDAQSALHSLERDQSDYLIKLATAGKSGTKDFKNAMKILTGELAHAHGAEAVRIRTLISLLNTLSHDARLAETAVRRVEDRMGGGSRGRPTPRAGGGPVKAGETYLVGEQHPELFVPERDGKIIPDLPTLHPAAGTRATASGGGGGVSLTINVSGVSVLTPGSAEALARQLTPIISREQQRQGLMPRVG